MKSQRHYEALRHCKKIFRNELSGLEAREIILFGSATYPGCFDPETSDMDILVLTNKATSKNLDCMADTVFDRLKDTEVWGKRPCAIRDGAGNRIEFSVVFQGVVLDCTVMNVLLPPAEELEHTAVHDSADVLIGAIVKEGVVISGDRLYLERLATQYLPFYSDTLRAKRLETISSYLAPKETRIRKMLESNNSEAIDYFFRYREIFLKWFFCYYRFYPVNLYKHLRHQFEQLRKNIDESELDSIGQRTLMLERPQPIQMNILDFLDFYDRLLKQWQQ